MMPNTVQPPYLRSEPAPSYAEESAQVEFLQRVLASFGSSLLMAAGGAYAAWSLAPQYYMPLMIAYIVLALAASFGRNSAMAPLFLYGFAAVSGAITVPLLHWAIAVTGGTAIVYNALTVTGTVFLGMAWYGIATRRDLIGWSTFLGVGLIGVLIAGLVGLFITHSTMYEMLWSVAIVVLFTGFTAYDINQIKLNWRNYSVSGAALTLYLDFLNLFIAIIRILAILNGGGGRDRD